jgi:hypothetical protein
VRWDIAAVVNIDALFGSHPIEDIQRADTCGDGASQHIN